MKPPEIELVKVKSKAAMIWMREAAMRGDVLWRRGEWWLVTSYSSLHQWVHFVRLAQYEEYMAGPKPKEVRGIPENQIYY